tara:strand:+ start:7065 stop:7358 length:294 start_codon:yes stop_codon:yes gene_type:complete
MTKAKHIYEIGDRVAERPIIKPCVSRAAISFKTIQRIGTVVGKTFKVNKRGSRESFLSIQWDHLKQPSEHAQHRICPLEELEKQQNFKKSVRQQESK